ncbi:MAG: hypothetical protein GY696_20015 [Gammaproteobacteria bacterium]|nr:hypothetical protein [Gammaproteobacteria bacterium]
MTESVSVIKVLLQVCQRTAVMMRPNGTNQERLSDIISHFAQVINTTNQVALTLYGVNPTDLHVLMETLKQAGPSFWTSDTFRYLRTQIVFSLYRITPTERATVSDAIVVLPTSNGNHGPSIPEHIGVSALPPTLPPRMDVAPGSIRRHRDPRLRSAAYHRTRRARISSASSSPSNEQ